MIKKKVVRLSRIWSLHPKYLDGIEIFFLWRNCIMAKKILDGTEKVNRKFPHLARFESSSNPIGAINIYLSEVYKIASTHGKNFKLDKFDDSFKDISLNVTKGQMEYEVELFKKKLRNRSSDTNALIFKIKIIEPNPLFKVVEGNKEAWDIEQ